MGGRVTVAGAGAIGLTCALALARAGFEVAVYDPAEPGENASGVAAGMLAPAFESVLDPASASHSALLTEARDLWPGLAADVGVQLDRQGALFIGDEARVEARAGALERLGFEAQRLSARGLAGFALDFDPEVTHGVLTRADWRLDAAGALLALRRAVRDAGAVLHQASAPERPGGVLLVATGASQTLAGAAPELAALAPVKGHILRLPTVLIDGPVVRGEGVYMAPSAQGLIVGATMEPGLADNTVDLLRARALFAAGVRLFPGIAHAPFVAMAGVRAVTPDALPLVGWSVRPDVLLAVGARRNGWLLAPLIATAVLDILTGDGSAPHQALFEATRFSC